jgi:hypothetical protein
MCLSAVIFTNYTDFPLNGILHWNKFSMILDEDGAHWVKDIFKGIKDADFTRLQDNLLKVKTTFKSSITLTKNLSLN